MNRTTSVNELMVTAASDDANYSKQKAVADANEHVAEYYPSEQWEFVDVDIDRRGNWSVRYRRIAPGPNAKRLNGPAWGELG